MSVLTGRHARGHFRTRTALKSHTAVFHGWLNRISQRRYASNAETRPPIQDVAILGGGITGLTSAFYLARALPKTPITLFEDGDRLGGWVNSEFVDIGTGKVVLEKGPRTLRPSLPNGLIALDLIRDLGLDNEIIATPKSAPAAQNRFIYFPDHLVRMPGAGASLLNNALNVGREPLFRGLVSGAFKEIFTRKGAQKFEDESIGSFISRHFGPQVVDNIVSAVLHGVYAGDVYNLSMRSLQPAIWHTADRYGSVVLGAVEMAAGAAMPVSVDDADWISMRRYTVSQVPPALTSESARKSSVFTLKEGIGSIVTSLVRSLTSNENVRLVSGTPVHQIDKVGSGPTAKMNITTTGSQPNTWQFSHVICTIPGSHLAQVLSDDYPVPSLLHTNSVTVMVVNLFYDSPDLLRVKGFGYLIPRSVPVQQNPHRALGVVFDSDSSQGQDTVAGTKLTVMLGGHWWNDFDDRDIPDEEEGAAMARAVLKQHLGLDAQPRLVRVSLQRNCIPQYTVGHESRMATAHRDLLPLEGRLRVAGSSYTGVGVNDCIRAASDVVRGLILPSGGGGDSGAPEVWKTGLESFVGGGRKWMWVPPEKLRNVR